MNQKVEFLVKTASIFLVCIAMMGACKCRVCEDGIDGVDGAQGAQGIPGNADTKMYTYGSKTSVLSIYINSDLGYADNSITYTIPLSVKTLENSHVYAYYQIIDSQDWYLVVSNAMFNLVTYISGSDYIVSFFTEEWVLQTPVVLSAFKIIVVPIPDENITEVKNAVSIDFGNYSEVAAYYGLPE